MRPDKDPNVRTWAYRLYIVRRDEDEEYIPREADYIIIANSKKQADLLAQRFCDSIEEIHFVVHPRWGASSEEMKGLWAKTRNIKTVAIGGGKYSSEYEKLKKEHLATVKVRRPGIYKPRGKEPIFE